MVLTSPSTAVAPLDTGYLNDGISATDTTITVAPIYKWINGVKTKQGFNTTSGVVLIQSGEQTERVSFESSSVDSTTKVTTLSSCTRGLSLTSTTVSFSAGTGTAFPKGAKISVVYDVSYPQSSVFTNVANTFTAKQTYSAGADFTSVTRPPKLPELTQAQEDSLDAEEGMLWKNSTTQTNRQYVSGAVVDIGDTGTPTAAESSEGKVELATVAEHDPSTTGARVVQAKNCITSHAIYTPAYLTGGSSATAYGATWTGVTDGSFTISIDGTEYDITGLDFSGAADEDGLAAVIQAGIRAETGSTETCVWDTDHFVITSTDTTSDSAITVTSAVGSGTDISGAGATAYMDAESGQGTVTDKVLDPTQDDGKIAVLDSNGYLNDGVLGSGTASSNTFLRGDSSWSSVPPSGIFGDLSDGDVTLSSETTLTKDMYYDTLDLDGNILNTAGYRIFAKNIQDSTGGGKIKGVSGGDGGNGGNSIGMVAGTAGTAGAAASGVTVPNSEAGKIGSAGTTGGQGGSPNGGNGLSGTSGASATNSLGSTNGVAGGAGGGNTQYSGGSAGAAGTATQGVNIKSIFYDLIRFSTAKGTTWTQITGSGGAGSGGSGAGGRGVGAGDEGGGGGGSGGSGGLGGYMLISAETLSGNWDIESLGGAGGNGGNGGNAYNVGDGGGGGGGGSGGSGGSVILLYKEKSSYTGSYLLTGGSGGTGGAGGSKDTGDASYYDGIAGSNGQTGANGIALEYQFS